jgi:hypothetical protein
MSRIPPEGEPLQFVRNVESGTVHILPVGSDGIERALPDAEVTAAEVLYCVGRRPMLCGTMLITGFDERFPACYTTGYAFTDDQLCVRCVRALGDQSWRAFHADNRDDPCEPVVGWRS